MPEVDIAANVKAFFENPSGDYCLPDERNASFDYCYNYFQAFRKDNKISEIASDENLEMSCLQIGFYLASWGMLRGSAFLSKRSVHHYKRLIKVIADEMDDTWDTGLEDYESEAGRQKILLSAEKIKIAISMSGEENEKVSKILITKVMLGIFGNIPAFDTFFEKGFGSVNLDSGTLEKLHKYYNDNKGIIDECKIYTVGFSAQGQTDIVYSTAKILDMVFFMEGDKLFKAEAEMKKQMKAQNNFKP